LLHRDLKPANVMLDGRGRVRLTDFGLASEARAQAAPGAGRREVAGTPAYMAPELLRGQPATVRSDLYALGLVLYEVFTGKRAFEAATIVELREKQERSQPASLSSSAGQLDPAIEEVIFRCLAPNPASRPASAIGVAAALPGGDPLAAALAAGETPSPAMVAAAGEDQGLALRPALVWLVSCLVLLGTAIGFVAQDGFSRHVPLEYPPDVLANKADEMLIAFGYPDRPADRGFGYTWHNEYSLYIDRMRRVADRWRPMRQGFEPGVLFWYRASDQALVPRIFLGFSLGGGRVTPSDPPPMRVGDRRLWLDTLGRLTRYEAVPPQVEDAPPATVPVPDWTVLFTAAGLDRARFTEATPTWVPLAMADARAAWTGTRAETPDTPLRLEAAAWRGRPVFFRVIGPWTRPERQEPAAGGAGADIATTAGFVIVFALVGICAWLARRNLEQGRADRRGAGRLALGVGLLILLGWFLGADHVASIGEVSLLIMGIAGAMFTAGMAWLLYVAFEPFVRRRWPHTIITWNRLLAGRVRDGLFGRDLLIGTTAGVGLGVLFFVQLAVARLVGPWAPEPVTPNFDALLGARFVAYSFVALLHSSIVGSLQVFSMIFVLVVTLRRGWAAALVLLGLTILQSLTGGTDPWLTMIIRVSITAVMVFVLLRYGLVTFAVANIVLSTLGGGFPLSVDVGRWYAGPSLVVWAGLVAMAFVGFRLAVGKQRLLASAEP
jgi:serine/threonine-protein kinase